jgi:hypothetical protein
MWPSIETTFPTVEEGNALMWQIPITCGDEVVTASAPRAEPATTTKINPNANFMASNYY